MFEIKLKNGVLILADLLKKLWSKHEKLKSKEKPSSEVGLIA